MEPIAAVVAGPEPEIAAKNIEARIATIDSPPVMPPTQASANLTRRCEIPPPFMSEPARTKKGIASSGAESTAENIRCASTIVGVSFAQIIVSAERPIETAIGAVSSRQMKSVPNIISMTIPSQSFPAGLSPFRS